LAIVSSAESMFSGDVTGEDCLRLEDRIDEYVVVHPVWVDGPGRGSGLRKLPSYAICSIGFHAIQLREF
jgi:hypothetical protein